MSILNVNKINPVGGGSTVTIAGIASVTGSVSATTFQGDGSQLTGISADSDKIFEGNTEVETVDTGSNGHIKFTTEGSERARILADGKIGIGITAPTSKLYVNGVSTNDVITARAADTNGVSVINILAEGTTGHSRIKFSDTAGTDGQISYTHTDRALTFAAGGTTERMRISSEGYVTKPYNPVFMVYRTSYYAITTSATALVFNEEKIDVGNNYDTSNGRFTAPVTGLYEFGYASIASNTQTVYRYDLRINGSVPYSGMRQELRIDQGNVTQYGTNGEFCLYINMTAGQYAQVYVHADTAVNSVYGDPNYGYTYFRGRLIQ